MGSDFYRSFYTYARDYSHSYGRNDQIIPLVISQSDEYRKTRDLARPSYLL